MMAEEKVTTTKRTTKKAAAATEAVKPKKATDAGKAAPAKPKKAPAAAKAATAKPAGEVKKKAPATKKLVQKPSAPSQEERQRWVATAAYHRAEKRGFAPGYEMQDWIDAEAEINALVGEA